MTLLSSLASALVPTLHERRSDCLLQTLDDTGDFPLGDWLRFQYFPETLSDAKPVNYNPREVPGGTLPIYQWMNSGERIISFAAVFTSDVDLATNVVGSITSDVSQLRVAALNAIGAGDRNVDIRSALTWLRRHTLPRYGEEAGGGNTTVFAPRKLKLYIPNSGIGLYGGLASSVTRDSIVCIMTLCDITFEAFFPSGLPRIVTVNLAFGQTAQYQGQVHFPSTTSVLDQVVPGFDLPVDGLGPPAPVPAASPALGVAPYTLTARAKITNPLEQG